jgi:uncharacterized membrane protein
MDLMGIAKTGESIDLGSSAALMDPAKQASALAIISNNCSGCHGETSGSAGIYGLTNVSHLISAGLLVPGNADSSRLYQVIAQGIMPPGGPLSAADQETIRSWIAGTGSSGAGGGGAGGSPGQPSPSPTPTPTPTPPTPVATFTYIRANILNKCVGCHNASSATAGYAFDTYTGTKRAVNLTTPNRSLLYTITQQGTMPPRPAVALTSDQTNLILSWIEKGALNN